MKKYLGVEQTNISHLDNIGKHLSDLLRVPTPLKSVDSFLFNFILLAVYQHQGWPRNRERGCRQVRALISASYPTVFLLTFSTLPPSPPATCLVPYLNQLLGLDLSGVVDIASNASRCAQAWTCAALVELSPSCGSIRTLIGLVEGDADTVNLRLSTLHLVLPFFVVLTPSAIS